LLKHEDLAEQKCHNTLFLEQKKQHAERDQSCNKGKGSAMMQKKKGKKHAPTIPNIRKMATFII